MKITWIAAWVTTSMLACTALAGDAEPANLYALSTQGSSSMVKVGEKGTLVIAIAPKTGAHVSDEAPLKIELSGSNVTPEKSKLVRADAKDKGPAPRFEVAFTGEAPGKGTLDAKLTFFICTDKICSRQQRTLSVPVDVR